MMRFRTSTIWLLAAMFLHVAGCAQTDLSEIHYHHEKSTTESDYRRHATEIAFPDVDSPTADEAMATAPPRTISTRHNDDVVEITLSEAIRTALQNNRIIRSGTSGITAGTSGSPILQSPTNVSSIYDPAIRESGVLFGGRGMESALAAFDARWTTRMAWNSDLQVANINTPSALTLNNRKTEGANFSTELSKVFGYGGQFLVGQTWNYSGVNSPTNRFFQSAFTGRLSAQFVQPLWAGAGREFAAIAGPISQNFNGLSGVTQGVLIARINSDISIADFEIEVRDMLFDVETTYWDLYLAYRQYDTTVIGVRSAFQTWKESKIKLEIGTLKASDEAQARDRFYETRAQAQTALATVFATELAFRRLLGLKVNNGTVLRPAEEPIAAEVVVDWQAALAEALTRRVEMRRQKWNIKSLQLQLKAAKSLVNPTLNFNAGYHLNGFGDELLSRQHDNANSAYQTLFAGNQPGWDLGLTMNVPIGFRSAYAQVRNIELRTARAMDVLAASELEITHQVGNAIQGLSQFHSVAKSNFNRLLAARIRVDKLGLELQEGTITPDPLVRAQASLVTAETAYYESLTNYNKKLAEFHYRKGTLLANYNIYLSEGPWSAQALSDAARRAHERANAIPDEHLHDEPNAFAFPDFRPGGQPAVQLMGYEEPNTDANTNTDAMSPAASSKPSDESVPTIDAPMSADDQPTFLGVPEVDDVPETSLELIEEPDPETFFDEPSFDLKEQDSFGMLDLEPETDSVSVFDLRELPSRNAASDQTEISLRGANAFLPVRDNKIQRVSTQELVIELSAPRVPVEIPDWIDLQPVPAKKPMVFRSQQKPQTKPTKTTKVPSLVKKSTERERKSDDFQLWKSEDPFWTENSLSRPAGNRLSEFEDYQPRFHTIK